MRLSCHAAARAVLPRIAPTLLSISLFACPIVARAWGDEGHQIVGNIADHYLDSAVRARVNQILAGDTSGLAGGTDIAHEATWADHFRDSDRPGGPHYTRTHNWHFVDIELSGPHFLAQPALGADAKAVTHDQHTNQQFGIDRRTSRVAVARSKVPAQLAQVEKAIDAAQQMTGWNVSVEIERVKQLVLTTTLLSHHLGNLAIR